MLKLVLITFLLYGCIHPSLYDAYQDARFLPVKITKFDKYDLEYEFYDSKNVVIGVVYPNNHTQYPPDFDWKKGEYMIYYCSTHNTLYAVSRIEKMSNSN